MLKSVARTALQSMGVRPQIRVGLAALYGALRSTNDASELDALLAATDQFNVLLEDRLRNLRMSGRTITRAGQPLHTYVMEDNPPWANPVEPIQMPGMISDEEAQYYEYVASLYQGVGEAVELGPWLGRSTRYIVRSLRRQPNFKRLHVFDDFVWRPGWMDQYVEPSDRFPEHANFRSLFDRYTADIARLLNVTRGKISDYDGNQTLPRITWGKTPIEIMYIDCGRTLQANEGWFETFSPSFVPGVTLLIMQDWQLHRERPRKPYNQTDIFTANHPELKLVHEVREGGLAAFLFDP